MKNYTYINAEASRREYEALPSAEWRRDYFNEENGGYLVTSWKRIEEARMKNEIEKYEVEHKMCLTFAKAGFRIQHLEEFQTRFQSTKGSNHPYRI